MARARILIVDDSAFIRRVLSEQLSADPDLEVVGHAPNGRIALQKVEQLNPDAMVLDVEMPELDGLSTLAVLRKTHPALPVLMFSALTEPAAAATVDALLLGATDYVTKPAAADSADRVREELIPKLKAACGRVRGASAPAPAGPAGPRHGRPIIAPARPARVAEAAPARPDVLVIGASTGGPNALTTFFSALPASFPIPIAVVQHMPPMFTRILAERLSQSSKIPVRECTDGLVPKAGEAYIAPGDFHLRFARQGLVTSLRTDREPPENACRPAVDVLFRSASEVYGRRVLALILTGMGQDGLRGAQALTAAGGRIWAQDEATSVVWGMPGAVARGGLAERVLALERIGPEVVRRVVEHPRAPHLARPAG